MVTGDDYPPSWAVLPGASLTAEFGSLEIRGKPTIEIRGNRQGFVSLGTVLLWASICQTESLSITGLSFVHVKSALSLTMVKQPDDCNPHERLIRVDKDQQFEWLLTDDSLQRQAVSIMNLGLSAWFYPSGDHTHGYVGPDCEFELFFDTDNSPGHSSAD